MELIYMNHNFEELGVVQDFDLDLAYGSDENNFELQSDKPLEIGMFWYAENTEYGGIIDKLKTDKDSETYCGRSWYGILASHHGYEVKKLSGNTVDVLSGIIEDTDLPFIVDVDNCSERDIEDTHIDKWQDLLSILLQICTVNNMKLKIYYDDGIKISLQNCFDFTQDAYFDISQYSVRMETSNQLPNHWIGRNVVDGSTYIKHIYLNKDGEIQPFTRTTDTSVTTDADYEYPSTDYGQQVFGIDEITETVDIENGKEDVYTKPIAFNEDKSVGNIQFYNGVPLNWEDEYYQYYYQIDGYDDDGEPKYKLYERKYGYVRYYAQAGDWWNYNWQNYFKFVNGDYKQLSDEDTQLYTTERRLTSKPSNWESSYSNYYTKSAQGVFSPVEGITQHSYKFIDDKTAPSEWYLDRDSLYVYHQYNRWKAVWYKRPGGKGKWKKTGTQYLYDDLSKYYIVAPGGGSLKPLKFSDVKTFRNISGEYDEWKNMKKGATTKIRLYRPTVYKAQWQSISDYCSETNKKISKLGWKSHFYGYQVETGKKAPTFVPNAYWDYYARSPHGGPPDPSGTYYERIDASEMFSKIDTYRKFENHYKPIVDKILEEIEKRKQESAKIEAKLETDVAEFDVGDIIGGVQKDKEVKSLITKKIVEANPFTVKVSYEIG